MNASSADIPFRDRLACTIAEACAATSLGKTKLRSEIAAGKIGRVKAGARTLVSVPSLLAYLEPEPAQVYIDPATSAPGIFPELDRWTYNEFARCLWCNRRFDVRTTGGSRQRFCRPTCRHEFGTAARRWAIKAIEAGLITVETMKACTASAHAVAGAEE